VKIDYSLYLVTDRKSIGERTLAEAVEQALLGGCSMVQLREKECSALDFYRQALCVKRITEKYQVPLILNDRADIALAVGADGVHIGQSDLPARAVRRLIGENRILGVSVSSLEQARQAVRDGADYLGVGAMFPTKTKADAERVSLEELARIRRMSDLPIVVIGGINRENAGLFRSMGIDGLAVISAVLGQPDIRKAAVRMREAVKS
jgi:thiamine-phosphate pyrophosphorylase